MKRMSVIAFLFWSMFLVAPAFAYTGSADFPDLFKYSDQKNTNLETALQSISSSFNEQEVTVTQELLAAIMATLVKEVEVHDFLPKEEIWDYGMGTGCSNPNGCKNDGIGHYEGGVDYKGRGYIQLTLKSNYEKYCPDCVGTSTPELDVCGCKNQMYCTITDAAICPQVKALQQKRAANIFASYYIKSPQGKDLVSLSNAKSYKAVGKAINGGDAYASDFNTKANAYLKLFSDNPDKTNRLLIWLNSRATNEEATQKEVTLTLYVHDGSKDGPIIPNAQVTGHDASDNSFQQTTDSNGYVTITGDSGTWSFSASATGYETNSWNQEITETDTKHAFLQIEEPQEYIRTNEYVDNSTATVCTPGSKSATCSTPNSCVDCESNCVSSGSDGGSGWSCDQGKWNFQPKSLSDLRAYRIEGSCCSIAYDALASMKIGNVMYDKGVQIQISCRSDGYFYAYFNLKGEYSRLTGLVGLDDSTNFEPHVNVTFIGDDVELQTINVRPGDIPVEVDIDVSGVRKLIVRGEKIWDGGQDLDLIDMKLTK